MAVWDLKGDEPKAKPKAVLKQGVTLFKSSDPSIAGQVKKADTFRADVAPDPDYQIPEAMRSIAGRPQIALDIETLDPTLRDNGPGAHRRHKEGGFICGVAIGVGPRLEDAEYYPTRHNQSNMENPDQFWNQLRAEAKEYAGVITGANMQYDLDWLLAEQGVKFPKAKIRDVQIAEPLLDENRITYRLEALARDYLGEGKLTDKLKELYGSGYITRFPEVHPSHAARYGKGDVVIPWQILEKQEKKLESEGLTALYDMESRLTPLLLEMRQRGVVVNHDAAEQALIKTREVRDEAIARIKNKTGHTIEIWSSDSIARAFDAENIPYTKTTTGKPSFTKTWLAACDADIAQMIIEAREYDKIGGTFIESYILNGAIQEGDVWRIHGMFNQLKGTDGGTVSGRFSSSYPNLQNIPARHPILGPMCRSIFVPEPGMDWGSLDWSQIEYRFLVHYASITKGINAAEAVAMYRNDPNTDFHSMAAEITGVERKAVKSINFGVVYGMGIPKLARSLGVSVDEARAIMAIFQEKAPFMRGMLDRASARASHRGVIKTILGRKRRFTDWSYGEELYKNQEDAKAAQIKSNYKYRAPQRAFTHKALNSLLQGSAADLMKQAMVEMWEGGIFDTLVPHLTVHDEFNSSVPRTKEGKEAFNEMRNIMETSMSLNIPVRADGCIAKNWAEAH